MPDNPVTSESMDLTPGDTLLFFSDGVTEAFDEEQELLGDERVLAHLAKRPGTTAAETVESVLARVKAHAGRAKQSDDISIVASRWSPDEGSGLESCPAGPSTIQDLTPTAPSSSQPASRSSVSRRAVARIRGPRRCTAASSTRRTCASRTGIDWRWFVAPSCAPASWTTSASSSAEARSAIASRGPRRRSRRGRARSR